MPNDITSPFTPGRPVPVEFFVGRINEIERLQEKVRRATSGRLEVGFVVGERGIGKSSLASFVRVLSEKSLRVLGLHSFLGGVSTLPEMVRRIFDRLLKESVETPWHQKLSDLFRDHVKEVGLFGVSLEFTAPGSDLSRLVNDFAPALRNLINRLRDDKAGLLLVLDDINGLAVSEDFANWLKSLVDEISTSQPPLPLCLLLVGLEERRESLINLQPSLARVFDLVFIRGWSDDETREFFTKAFSEVEMTLEPGALDVVVTYTGGLPVLAHEIGDAVFNAAEGEKVLVSEAMRGIVAACDIVGHKYLEPRVVSSLRSPRYHQILKRIATVGSPFTRASIQEQLTSDQRRVLDNFLRKMVDLGVLFRPPEGPPGTYGFTNRLHSLYFALQALREERQRVTG